MRKLHLFGVTMLAVNRSWASEIWDSIVSGVEGKPAVAIDTTKPLGSALADFNAAANTLGGQASAIALTTVNTALETHVGPAGTMAADLLLQAIISAATAALSPTAKAPAA